ncbi:MAG TPA: hypothetical protein V6D22_01535 [Candidatus Obscuribacterales bacterium]
MDPTADKQKEAIKLVVSTQESTNAPLELEQNLDDQTPHHTDTEAPDRANGEMEHSLKMLAICAAGFVVTFVALLFLRGFHGFFLRLVGLVLGMGWLGFFLAAIVFAWRCVKLWWRTVPALVSVIGLAALNLQLIAMLVCARGSHQYFAYFGLILMLMPPSALWCYRQLKTWQKLKATSALSIDQSGEPNDPSKRSDGPTDLSHELLHSAGLIKTCTASCDIMKNVGESWMKSCHRCGSTLFRPEELQRDDFKRLDQIRRSRVATNQDARTYRRADGTYILGSCSAVFTHSLPAVVLSAPFALTGLSLLLAPEFIMPFFNNPTAQALFVLATVWHLFGCWLYTRTNLIALRTLILIVFNLPLLLAPVLGPAIVTVMMAF